MTRHYGTVQPFGRRSRQFMIINLKKPRLIECFVAKNATVIGDVTMDKESSIWYHAVVRGDEAPIRIGKATNIQDNCTLHCSEGYPLTIGDGVTVGHNAVLHGCTIGNNVLIGMGAIVLNGAVIGDGCIIGAGSLITENKVLDAGTIAYGLPGKPMGKVTEADIEANRRNALMYIELAKEHFGNLFPLNPEKI